jgi:short-subunit dehydrogenase
LFIELKAGASPVGVSVLCPGFVRTELMDKMTWADRLGALPSPSVNPMSQFVDQMLREGVENGMSPADVAARVVDAIHAEQFWILTHDDYGDAPVDRMSRAVAQQNPM